MSAEMDLAISRIDWALLRGQKVTLLGLIANTAIPSGTASIVDGVVHLIDSLQDAAVADGAPYEEVFGAEHD